MGLTLSYNDGKAFSSQLTSEQQQQQQQHRERARAEKKKYEKR
jgi:hypothetical protein